MPSCQTPSHSFPSRNRDRRPSSADAVHEIHRPGSSPVTAGTPSTSNWDRLRPLLVFVAVFVALGATAMIYAHFALK